MKHHTYVAEGYPTVTRTTHRVYTHVIIAHANRESALRVYELRKPGIVQMADHTYEYYTTVSNGGGVKLYNETPEQHKQKGIDWLTKIGMSKEAYIQHRLDEEFELANSAKDSSGALVWCGRYDLALKQRDKYAKLPYYSKVEIVPVHIKK